MFTHDRKALTEISARLKQTFPDDIEAIYAFGSRARGDNGEHSDLDVLIIVKGKTPEKEERIIGAIVDEETIHDLSLIPVLKDSDSFALERRYNSPFYQNIMAEGISL